MTAQILFTVFLAILFFLFIILDVRYNLLRDKSEASRKPYSFSRVQLAWWTILVLASFIAIIFSNEKLEIPTLDTSTLILLGISASTMMTARLIDISDNEKFHFRRHQNETRSSFFIDILSDENGVSIHRLQSAIIHVVFGVWFIANVWSRLGVMEASSIDSIIPVISQNNLILLGLSSGTYAALKATENRQPIQQHSAVAVLMEPASDVPPAG